VRAEVLTGAEYEKAIEEESGVGKKQSVQRKRLPPAKDSEYRDKSIDEESFTDNTKELKKCEWILAQLNNHRLADKFNKAIILGYTQTIKNPISLSTLEQGLRENTYSTLAEFIEDARKIWDNVITNAKPGTELHQEATAIANYFEGLVNQLVSAQPKNHRKNFPKQKCKEYVVKPMTNQEKALLKNKIMLLPQEKLKGIIKIIKSTVDTSRSSETLEFDIDQLPIEVIRALNDYVKANLPEQKRNSRKKLGVSIRLNI
jgi:hypothetical protein